MEENKKNEEKTTGMKALREKIRKNKKIVCMMTIILVIIAVGIEYLKTQNPEKPKEFDFAVVNVQPTPDIEKLIRDQIRRETEALQKEYEHGFKLIGTVQNAQVRKLEKPSGAAYYYVPTRYTLQCDNGVERIYTKSFLLNRNQNRIVGTIEYKESLPEGNDEKEKN